MTPAIYSAVTGSATCAGTKLASVTIIASEYVPELVPLSAFNEGVDLF